MRGGTTVPCVIDYELMLRLKDRYEPEELFELLDISMEELVDCFDEKIMKGIEDESIEL